MQETLTKESSSKRRVYIDIEANGLLDTISRIWCIVAKDVDSGEIFCFHPTTSTACRDCSGGGSTVTPEGVSRCDTCDGAGKLYTGDHTEWVSKFKDLFDECDHFIGHNIIGYDAPAIEKILGLKIPLSKMTDTLVWSRLFRPVSPPGGTIAGGSTDPTKDNYTDNRIGGHSLGAWGKRLGYAKQDFDDWSKYSDQMLAYCVNDVELGIRIWQYLELERLGLKDPLYLSGEIKEPIPFGDLSVRLEQSVASCLRQQELNGFKLDITAAEKLRDDTEALLLDMNKDLDTHFPPVDKYVRNWEPSFTKNGELTKPTERMLANWTHKPVKGAVPIGFYGDKVLMSEYELFETQQFNPNSGQQVAARLIERGWKPKHYTPTGAPSTAKEHLRQAVVELKGSYPELEFLENYSIVYYNNQKAKKWLEIVEDDGRVHGRINPIGAATARCTHSDDNMANIASVRKNNKGEVLEGVAGEYGWDCRSCWTVDSGNVLVGADASGIQLRALAHYMNDPRYTKEVCEGDIHTVNQKAAGIADRPTAKTFIYAWLLGAGDETIGSIVGLTDKEVSPLIQYGLREQKYGRQLTNYVMESIRKQDRPATRQLTATIIKGHKTKKQFLERTPALKRLREVEIASAAKRGYVTGLDGRKLWIPSEHLAMSLYLQGYEAVIMKAAICCYQDELKRRGIPFKQAAFVHDEVQIECKPEHADIVGQAVVEGIKKAGRIFKSNCPLDGEYQIGNNWAETH